jgi:DNA mismatch endonuclease, patch repair protein
MSDVFSKAKRSEVMSLIRSRGNKATELAFMQLLRHHGITGWRRHVTITMPKSESTSGSARSAKVRPDFVFPKSKVAIFIDGCFWHGCPTHGTSPSSNSDFWSEKLAVNKKRDLRVNRQLRRRHWSVIRFWEHQLNDGARLISRVRTKLESDERTKM